MTQNTHLARILAGLPKPAEITGTIGQVEKVRLALKELDTIHLLWHFDDNAHSIEWDATTTPPDVEGCDLLNAIADRCCEICKHAPSYGGETVDVFQLYPFLPQSEIVPEFSRLHEDRPEPITAAEYQLEFGAPLLDRARALIQAHSTDRALTFWELLEHPCAVVAELEAVQHDAPDPDAPTLTAETALTLAHAIQCTQPPTAIGVRMALVLLESIGRLWDFTDHATHASWVEFDATPDALELVALESVRQATLTACKALGVDVFDLYPMALNGGGMWNKAGATEELAARALLPTLHNTAPAWAELGDFLTNARYAHHE